MGVSDEFYNFRNNYNIGTDLISSIAQRYRRITTRLNTDFWNTDSSSAHSLYVGSYGRDTAARGISDLDIGFQLPYAEYVRYSAYQGNGQSALLQAVKNSLLKTYGSSKVGGDGQVVVISFTDGITFEILPYFSNTDGSWTFADSNEGGVWRECNPRAEMNAVQIRNERCPDTQHGS
ncbi:nucleotidyltransferase [Mesorhizobium sp. M2A.F.Ca.ET.043.05.1.1]|uniref:SMODS domain-containing nucleotidyltransferase n=1 Tax=Mesorhizobium sp. M2A.F.Ca.ET.043.05.1.1 TaxID=2493671 RepID=UPI001AECF755|nr:nucleotidyltransferase [Mesorhizobium sp. M2A.F.Ca.ET.043.05.1.1]